MPSLFDEIIKDPEIEALFSPEDKILIALSGGPDSVFLLHFLLYLKEKYHLKLFVSHLNHMIRGKEAERDAHFAQRLAKEHDLPFEIQKIDVPDYAKKHSLSLEEAARIKRYEFLLNISKKYNLSKVAIAHTLNDFIETFFIRLIRGTGLSGLESIPIRRKEDNIEIIRPLLKTSKEDILYYLKSNKLPYIVDSTNKSLKYLRNIIRENILPQFLKLNPNFYNNTFNLINQIKETNLYLSSHIDKVFENLKVYENKNFVKIDLPKFKKLSNFLKSAILRKAIEAVSGNLRGIYYSHIIDLLKLINSVGEKDYVLPHKIKIKKTYNYLFVYTGDPLLFSIYPPFLYNIFTEKEIYLKDLGVKICLLIDSSSDKIKDFDIVYKLPYNILKEVCVRNRKEGDKIKGKKLKKIFIDMKIPRYLRDKIPLISTGEEIIEIIGITKPKELFGDYFKIGVKFEKGGLLWSELYKRFLLQKNRYRTE